MLPLVLGYLGLALLLAGVAWALAILRHTRPARWKAGRRPQHSPRPAGGV